MCGFMLVPGLLEHETLATNTAVVRLFTGVSPHVVHTRRPRLERGRAQLTLVRPLPSVDSLVGLECVAGGKRCRTNVA